MKGMSELHERIPMSQDLGLILNYDMSIVHANNLVTNHDKYEPISHGFI